MSYRIIKITKPSECHVSNGQLIVEQEDGKAQIPLEDIEIVLCTGAKIRFSTMGLGQLAHSGILVAGFGKKHEPEILVEPCCVNARHPKILFQQIKMEQRIKDAIWDKIIRAKIMNQARNLTVLGLDGTEKIASYSDKIHDGDKHNIEAVSALEYFKFYHKGLNRRTADPLNSALNYGYAVIRSYIIKILISAGFHCALGIKHHNEFNSYNLADDMIEPWRAMADQLAFSISGNETKLSSKVKKDLAEILHCSCIIDEKIMWISTGIEMMIDSYKNAMAYENPDLLKLPILINFKELTNENLSDAESVK